LPEAALEIRDLNVFHGKSHILQDVTLRAEVGSVLGLFGPNGAGKTTLLRTIVGQIRERNGMLRASGIDLIPLTPHQISALGIAIVPQGRRIFASLTVRENLAIARRIPNGRRPDQLWTMDRALEIFPRLAERSGHFGASLSGGEQQMLAVARALMNNPRLLLMDEPFEGMSPQIVASMFAIIQRLKREKLSIVLVEQKIAALTDLVDSAYLLKAGRGRAVDRSTFMAQDRSSLTLFDEHLT